MWVFSKIFNCLDSGKKQLQGSGHTSEQTGKTGGEVGIHKGHVTFIGSGGIGHTKLTSEH